MFNKILIANRGEIACRVIKTARKMGITTVAIHSDADRHALHVQMADEAVHIGPSPASESYIVIEKVMSAIRQTGAEAVHPGYGFLSENPRFAEALEAEGVAFVGPPKRAIEAMGDKITSKKIAAEAGVSTVPGVMGLIADAEEAVTISREIGYPVMIKASAGGGGKGMRIAWNDEEAREGFQSSKNEAASSFGDDRIFIEKFVTQPRHIEIQVLCDSHGNGVYLGERECSIQRRNQKVIEEAPSPFLDAATRRAMGEQALALAHAVGYASAGTVEFIVDGARNFFFLEMNTRLQVEHPVTEAITGVDLVEWQLRVAAGEGLPARQEDLTINGHAFEARLYAEDVPKGFLPATGRLTHLAFPAGCRADSGVRADDEISPFYDPMIAKVITHGPTRAVALRRLSAALDGTQVAGTVTNLAFLGALARHEGFAKGEVDTGLIARDIEALVVVSAPGPREVALAVLGGLGLLGQAPEAAGFALWQPLTREVRLIHGGEEIVARLTTLSGDAHDVELGDAGVEARRVDGAWRLDGAPAAPVAVDGRRVTVFAQHGLGFDLVDPLDREAAAGADAHLIEAPMPGLVKAVHAKAGQAVSKGDRLAVLEAMKMEHSLLAARDGVVAEVLARAGDQVTAGAALIRLEEAET